MKRITGAKYLMVVLAVWAVAGCVSNRSGSAQDPDRARQLAKVRTELAADYFGRKQYAIALEELDKAMKADSRYAPAYSVRGLVHMALLEDGEAESDFRRSLELDPANSETHNNYGWFMCQRGRERDSVKQFLIAAKDPLYPTPGIAYLNAGTCAKKSGQMQDAGLYLQRALILQPDSPNVLVELADFAFVSGDYAGAWSYFARFEKAASGQMAANNLFLAVRIKHKLGDRGGEATYAGRLRKDFPDSRESVMLRQIR